MSKKGEKSIASKIPFKTNPFIVFLLIWGASLVVQSFYFSKTVDHVSYTKFIKLLEEGKIKSATVSEDAISAELMAEVDGKKILRTIPVQDPTLTDKLLAKGVEVRGTPKSDFWSKILTWMFPILLIVLLWRFMSRQVGNAQGGLLNFGKSKAKVFMEKDIKTTFQNVAGIDEAKDELIEIVNFLKNPTEYGRLGGRAPKGILLVGPPGTGKTLLARAVAGEASVPFYSINGSEFVEMFVGMGAARVRDLFEQARKSSPCILFIDELDALGRSRGMGPSGMGGHDEKEQTLNQLLAELDGFDASSGIVLLAATNRPEVLDPALLRAGRFDRQILVDKPDRGGREAILKIHSKKIKLGSDVRLIKVAELTPGFSGADLENLCNEAALTATRNNAKTIEEKDFTYAIERIVAGLERKKRLMNPNEKRRVAYHEMGHATVALGLECADRVHKISVIPRGIGALGYTLQRPTEDRYLMTQTELLQKMAVLLGGRVSEDIFFEELSTGASDDLVKATNIARAMVTQYAMSEKLGLATYEQQESRYLQEMGLAVSKDRISEKSSQLIDQEITHFLNDANRLAKLVLEKNRPFVENGLKALLETETLDEDQIVSLWERHGRRVGKNILPIRSEKMKTEKPDKYGSNQLDDFQDGSKKE